MNLLIQQMLIAVQWFANDPIVVVAVSANGDESSAGLGATCEHELFVEMVVGYAATLNLIRIVAFP